ncbi:MAG: manganese efflux pump MntP family protein [Clostridiales Family XIII bacterium]|jgi:putative Mn2+ efflux pump MntP|nr:manganese efflux pump MntP family protein [Clostridiales Family XIII bacterium]
MSIIEVFLIALGLSADATAVSAANGMKMSHVRMTEALKIAAAFGIAQALMPVIGYVFGLFLASYVSAFDHIIALLLLGYIGGKMVYEGLADNSDNDIIMESTVSDSSSISAKTLIMQAIATSIDALVVGFSFSTMGMGTLAFTLSVLIIGVITFIMSIVATHLGKRAGDILGSKAEIVGGLILIGIGLKIFIEHTWFGG